MNVEAIEEKEGQASFTTLPVTGSRLPRKALPRCAPRGLLLDFGSVISVSVFERHRASERLLGLREGTLTWLGPLDPATDPLWESMQRDEITEREYWASRAAELGAMVGEPGWDVMTMLQRIRQADANAIIRPQMQHMMRVARANGMRVGILSNELELFYGSEMLTRMDVLAETAMIVDASSTGILKPDPRAYAQATQGLGLLPEEILFVDDQFRNIVGAVKAGLQTQYFDLRDIPGNLAAIAARLQLRIEGTSW